MCNTYNDKGINPKDYMGNKSNKWNFDFMNNLELDNELVLINVLNNFINESCVEHESIVIEDNDDVELPPELDIKYHKKVATSEIVEDKLLDLVIVTFNTQKSKDNLNIFLEQQYKSVDIV